MRNFLSLALCALAFIACQKKTETTNENVKVTDTVSKSQQPVTQKTGYAIGDEATDFLLKATDGKMYALSQYKDAKGFIVIFTCNHCPYAKAYEERIVALDAKYKPLGFPVIAINPNDPSVQPEDSFELMKIRANEKGFTFPYLTDDEQKIFPQYGATKTPHVFVLQKENGKNIVKYIGAIDNNHENPKDVTEKYVENAVDALLKNEPVKQPETVAIGCSIKVKQ